MTITLCVNEWNASTKRHRLAEWTKKWDPYKCCLQETHFRPRDTCRLKVRGRKKIFHENGNQKKVGVAVLILDKFSSAQFSRSVVSDSLWCHGLQHPRLPCLSPTPEACSNSCPLCRWCRPNISSSVIPFSSRLQSFPASGSFPMSQFFASDGQCIGVSVSASVLPVNFQDWFPLGLTAWISLQSKGFSRVFSNTTVQTHQFFGAQLSL